MKKGMFSIIVPAHKLFKREDGRMEIEAAIDSVLDQDYTNYEIIVCANGEDKQKVIDFVNEKYPEIKTIDVIVPEEFGLGNAAVARNMGADVAEGEFYSFFSSDLVMHPGTLSRWKLEFDKNPDVSIVYGDVDYMKNGLPTGIRGYMPKYDRYHHECENLIDGAFPVRAKYHDKWYPEVKALQDWCWSLGCTAHAPAIKIEHVGYSSELPKEGGLSHHFGSGDNYAKLTRQIKKIHNIPIRKWVVASLGAPFHGLRTAKYLGMDFCQQVGKFNHEYEVVYLLGYFTNSAETIQQHNRVFAKALNKDCIRMIHWIGSDVMQLMGMSWEGNRNLVETLQEYVDIHISEFGFTNNELNAMQLKNYMLPLPENVEDFKFIKKKPEKFTVAVYAPGYDEYNLAKYNLGLMIDVAKAMPDIDFIFFGTDDASPPDYPNIKVQGWTPIKEIAEKSNVLLRFPIHDGLPMSPIEFLMYGRQCITSVPFTGTYYIGSGRVNSDMLGQRKADIIEAIRNVKKNPLKREEKKQVRDYWIKQLDPKRIKRELNKIVKARRLEIEEMKAEAEKIVKKEKRRKKKDAKS